MPNIINDPESMKFRLREELRAILHRYEDPLIESLAMSAKTLVRIQHEGLLEACAGILEQLATLHADHAALLAENASLKRDLARLNSTTIPTREPHHGQDSKR